MSIRTNASSGVNNARKRTSSSKDGGLMTRGRSIRKDVNVPGGGGAPGWTGLLPSLQGQAEYRN